MIQELFGGRSSVTLINGDRSKLPINNTTPNSTCNNNNSSSSSSSPSSAISSTNAAANPTSENLRCPRCDSSNTKFCYYNNYNLTQPRHFCKTCRRYWTRGGALRNVPIGGGCRKNKSPNVSVQKSTSAAGKLIKAISPEIGMLRSSSPLSSSQGMFMSGLDQHVDQYNQTLQNPIFWAANSQSPHFLSLLRANQNQNPNPNPNHHVLASSVKENDGMVFSAQSQFGSEPNLISGMNHPLQTSSIGLASTNYYSNRSVGQSQGIVLGEVQNRDGLQELYQKLRSSPADNYNNAPVILGNASSSSSSFSSAVTTVLESAPVASSGELGFWNSSLSWTADLTATNGAYP